MYIEVRAIGATSIHKSFLKDLNKLSYVYMYVHYVRILINLILISVKLRINKHATKCHSKYTIDNQLFG